MIIVDEHYVTKGMSHKPRPTYIKIINGITFYMEDNYPPWTGSMVLAYDPPRFSIFRLSTWPIIWKTLVRAVLNTYSQRGS